MANISIHQSVTGFSAEKLTQATNHLNNKMTVQKEDSNAKAAIKYLGQGAVGTVASLTQLALGVLAIVETVARHAFAIIAKIITFLLPEGYAKKVDEKVSALFNHAKLASETVAKSFTKAFTFSKVEAKGVNFNKAYNSRVMEAIKHFHINGDSRKDETPKTEEVQKNDPIILNGRAEDFDIKVKDNTIVAQVEENSEARQAEETTETPTTTEGAKTPSFAKRCTETVFTKRNGIIATKALVGIAGLVGLGYAGVKGYQNGLYSAAGNIAKNYFGAALNTTKGALNATRGYFASKLSA